MCSRGYGGVVSIINAYGDCVQFTNNKRNVEVTIDDILDDMFSSVESTPMVLCRTNKQVRALQDLGIVNVSTVHQAKGLEYDKVIVVDIEISEVEDLNVAYVALTRARNKLAVVNWGYLESYLKNKKYAKELGYTWG